MKLRVSVDKDVYLRVIHLLRRSLFVCGGVFSSEITRLSEVSKRFCFICMVFSSIVFANSLRQITYYSVITEIDH